MRATTQLNPSPNPNHRTQAKHMALRTAASPRDLDNVKKKCLDHLKKTCCFWYYSCIWYIDWCIPSETVRLKDL